MMRFMCLFFSRGYQEGKFGINKEEIRLLLGEIYGSFYIF